MNISSIGASGISLPAEAAQPRAITPDQRSLIRAVKSIDAAGLFGDGNQLTYVFDRGTHKVIVQIVDRETGDVVGEIPAVSVLKLAEEIPGEEPFQS